MKESELVQQLRLAASKLGARIFRNNCGKLIDRTGQWVAYGVASPGGSDLIGWHTVTVTPEMVGRKVAVFVAWEAKVGSRQLTKEQCLFLAAVSAAGGIAAEVRSVESAELTLNEFASRHP